MEARAGADRRARRRGGAAAGRADTRRARPGRRSSRSTATPVRVGHAVPDRVDHEAVHGRARVGVPGRSTRGCARWLSHSAGLPLRVGDAAARPGAEGLWSYSNAGYWAAGRAAGARVRDVVRGGDARARARAARARARPGSRAGAAGARTRAGGRVRAPRGARVDAYPVRAAAVGRARGRPSPTCSRSARPSSDGDGAAFEPQIAALGARYALGWWVRERAGGATRRRPRGLGRGLPVAPAARAGGAELALAVLTNSWRGSALSGSSSTRSASCRRAAGGAVDPRRRRDATRSTTSRRASRSSGAI